jgi:hypothetical protein
VTACFLNRRSLILVGRLAWRKQQTAGLISAACRNTDSRCPQCEEAIGSPLFGNGAHREAVFDMTGQRHRELPIQRHFR